MGPGLWEETDAVLQGETVIGVRRCGCYCYCCRHCGYRRRLTAAKRRRPRCLAAHSARSAVARSGPERCKNARAPLEAKSLYSGRCRSARYSASRRRAARSFGYPQVRRTAASHRYCHRCCEAQGPNCPTGLEPACHYASSDCWPRRLDCPARDCPARRSAGFRSVPLDCRSAANCWNLHSEVWPACRDSRSETALPVRPPACQSCAMRPRATRLRHR
jgi:hypothetical protein